MIKKNSFLKFIVAMSVLIAMLASCSNGDGSKEVSSGVDAVSIVDKEASENSSGEGNGVSEENTESASSEEVLDNSEILDNSDVFDNVNDSDASNSAGSSTDSSQMVTDEIPEGYKVVREADGKTIVYGLSDVAVGFNDWIHNGGDIKNDSFFVNAKYFLDSEEYNDAYYYVAIDSKDSYEPSFTAEEEKAYFESFGIDCSDKTYFVYFTYVTEEQMTALANEVATDERPIPYARIYHIHENAKEEYIQNCE